jgi:branched-chain amino acid transport system ATP-binding protein
VTLLALENVHAYYGEAHILQGVSLGVGPGEVVTLIGRNGAGKTTTLRSVMRLVVPRSGRIAFDGRDLAGRPTHEVSRLGIAYVPEERRILPNLTVEENLRLGILGSRGSGVSRSAEGGRGVAGEGSLPSLATPDRVARPDRGEASNGQIIEEVLTFFPQLRQRFTQKGRGLSGGEQQMLAIARGLVARPKLMLVDEPTEGLSPLIVQNLTEIMRRINQRGTAILLVEQNLEVAVALSHRLYVMDQGRIQFEGTPDALRRDPTVAQRFLGV